MISVSFAGIKETDYATTRRKICQIIAEEYVRYDIMLEPVDVNEDAFVIEFRAAHPGKGETLETAVDAALEQIEKKQYETVLRSREIPEEKIRKYGFAFAGSRVLIGRAR